MELNHLKAFYEVARSGGFSAAARKLRISQSALSKAVANLEDIEGVRLFQRGKKGVVLTDIGERIFSECVEVFERLRSVEEIIHGGSFNCEGPLRFGASDHFLNYLLIDRICGFQRKYPKVIPSCFSGSPLEIAKRLNDCDLEFGLFSTRVEVAGIELETIGRAELVFVESKSTASSKGGQDSSSGLTARDSSKRGSAKRVTHEKFPLICSISRDYVVHPSQLVMGVENDKAIIAMESNSQEAQKRLCLAGGGRVLLARFMVKEEIKEGKLKVIKSQQQMHTDVLIAKRRSHVFTPAARKFIEEVLRKIEF